MGERGPTFHWDSGRYTNQEDELVFKIWSVVIGEFALRRLIQSLRSGNSFAEAPGGWPEAAHDAGT